MYMIWDHLETMYCAYYNFSFLPLLVSDLLFVLEVANYLGFSWQSPNQPGLC